MSSIFRCCLMVACLMVAAALTESVSASQRGYADKAPTAQDIEPPRRLGSMGYAGKAQRDSVMSAPHPGANALPPTIIKLPTGCDMDNTQPGCSGYCAAHPGAYGCGGEPLPGKN